MQGIEDETRRAPNDIEYTCTHTIMYTIHSFIYICICRCGDDVQHFKVMRNNPPGKYSIWEQHFTSINALVQHHRSVSVSRTHNILLKYALLFSLPLHFLLIYGRLGWGRVGMSCFLLYRLLFVASY